MAKLRKMLGHPDDPAVRELMAAIEARDKQAVARWAAEMAETRYLPVYRKAFPDGTALTEALRAAKQCAGGEIPLTALKASVKAARALLKEAASGGPAAEAAARAAVTAAGVMASPGNSLGCCFYGAAAAAYDALGTSAAPAAYDRAAEDELNALLAALRETPAAEHPAPWVNWNC